MSEPEINWKNPDAIMAALTRYHYAKENLEQVVGPELREQIQSVVFGYDYAPEDFPVGIIFDFTESDDPDIFLDSNKVPCTQVEFEGDLYNNLKPFFSLVRLVHGTDTEIELQKGAA